MPPTKKRAHSPEVDGLLSTRQNRLIRVAPVKRRWRTSKDNRIKALHKLESSRRCEVFQYTAYQPNTTCPPQVDTRVHSTASAPSPSPLQHSPGPAEPQSPPSLPTEGGDYDTGSFHGSPLSPHVPLGSGLRGAASIRDNRALFRQTQHLDDHTSAWNKRRNNQSAQWRSVTIPRLMPIYLANRAATESGRLPPPPKPNHLCQCIKVTSKVEMITWDRKFSPHCCNCLLIVFFIRIFAEDIVYLRVPSSRRTVNRNGLLPMCPDTPDTRFRHQPPGICNDWVASHGAQCNRVVKHTSVFSLHPRVSCW